jgi:hypothetical protein
MKRRDFLGTGLWAGIAATTAFSHGELGERYLVLDWYRCRRDQDLARMRGFLGESLVPAYGRAGIKPVGTFQTSVGPDNPSFMVVSSHPSLGGLQDFRGMLERDEKWTRECREFDEKWELAYDRMESSLLQGFRTLPGIEVPRVEEGRSNLFELRIYESRNAAGHQKKVAMFNNGEIDIFRRCGINPVFFGSTIFGSRMPNLTYLVWYPSWDARAAAWAKFVQDSEWKKLSTAPGNADRELVSSISNQLMNPLPFSQIR